jgi:hypothetical protein
MVPPCVRNAVRPSLAPTAPVGAAYCRAGGRWAYNTARQRQASARQVRALMLLIRELGFRRGAAAEAARRLGVHRGTISRGPKAILRQASPAGWRLSYGLMQSIAQPLPLPKRRGRPPRAHWTERTKPH